MKTKKITRGISDEFAAKINQDEFLQRIYGGGSNGVIWAIRNGYVNLYYNSDSVALIRSKLTCRIDNFYLTGVSGKEKVFLTPQELFLQIETIKRNSDKRATNEKKTQQKLFMLNNSNAKSNWFCVDIEYAKAYATQADKDKSGFSPRFDIVAISKKKPFRIAIVELKYGKGAYSGVSGIRKHIVDFDKMKKSFTNNDFKNELIEVINSLRNLGVKVPVEYTDICATDFSKQLEFYFITLDSSAETNGSTARQTCAGYLFNTKKWGCKRLSKNNIEQEYGDITDPENDRLFVRFLFSKQTIDSLTITDIIDGQYDEENI